MSEAQYHNKQWGVEDFKRYHSGQMPVQEMHALEKASLDDPFLEDALEGYAFTKTAAKDIEELKERLTPKKKEAKIIWYKQKAPAKLLRIAAMLVLFAGFSWLLYQNKVEKKDEIASVNKPVVGDKKKDTTIPDTISSTTTILADLPSLKDTKALPKTNKINPVITDDAGEATQSIAAAPANNDAEVATAMDIKAKEEKSVAASVSKSKMEEALAGRASGVRVLPANIITGRVVDKQGQPVSSAIIKDQTNKQTIAADGDGKFFLNNTQNAANVKIDVNAVGYATTNASINAGNTENKIVLQQSDNNLSEVVVTGYGTKRSKKSAAASAQVAKSDELNISARLTLKNATPVAGWENFNLAVNELIKNSKTIDTTGQVILLFDIDTSGIAKNISVKKSLGLSCDEEAIRLLQASPAMKKIKKGRKAEAVVKF